MYNTHVKKAAVELIEGYSFDLHGTEALRLYQAYQNGDREFVIHESTGPVIIHRDKVLFTSFTEFQQANEIQALIDENWFELKEMTGCHSQSPFSWMNEGNSTFIMIDQIEKVKVSDDPHVAELLKQIRELESEIKRLYKEVDQNEKV